MHPESPIRVSVIVPSYNYGNYIAECLDSVSAQTFRDWECIVIDNGSTDHTAEVVKAYAEKDSRIRYHYTEQSGVSLARNKAVELSKGKYILPLDADDKIAPTYLEKAVAILEKEPGIKLVYCDAELFGAFSGKWVLPEYSLRDMLIENSIFCSAFYRKADFDTAGGYDENMKEGFEDWDFWIRMLKGGEPVYKIPEALFYYRMRLNSRNGVLTPGKQLSLRRKIFENHRSLYEASFSLPEFIFEYYELKKELAAVKSSADVKAGSLILKPARFLKKIFYPVKK
jgi:glycosyltransferase involved in cell wall biosynthesis